MANPNGIRRKHFLSKAGISMSVRNEAKVNSNTQRFIVYFGRSYFAYGATFNFTRGGKG